MILNITTKTCHQKKLSNYKVILCSLLILFKLLNLNEAASELSQQASSLSQINILSNENYAQQLMKSILSAMNAIGILVRHYSSNRLQIRVNNTNISRSFR